MPIISQLTTNGKYSYLSMFLKRLGDLAPMQLRTIEQQINNCDSSFLDDSERFFYSFNKLLQVTGTSLDQAVQSYVAICKGALQEQFKFSRSGQYSASSFEEAQGKISDYDSMMHYMLGLAVTQYLWPQHHETLRFFRKFIEDNSSCGHYLEIGPGHGLYLLEAMQRIQAQSFAAVDISQASIDITEKLVSSLVEHDNQVSFHVHDIFEWSPNVIFDVIVMGEVLEHVEDPAKLLMRAASFIAPGGKLFITTCANCPAIDHIYLFETAEEIRALIKSCGCNIEREHTVKREVGMRKRGGGSIVTTQFAAVLSVDK